MSNSLSSYNIINREKSQARALYSLGFTIVELLIVVVVIAVLAAVAIVSYNGITSQAKESATKSELSSISKQLEMIHISEGSYPESLDVAGLQHSSDSSASYTRSAQSYCVSMVVDGKAFYVSESSGSPQEGDCSGNVTLTCPDGFIQVPGDARYGTSDFCVMKYEAKVQGVSDGQVAYSSSLTPESRPSGTPWVTINQNQAIEAAKRACSNCHLITEPQWMTIAANALGVADNWSGGVVGSGHLYSGHTHNGPGEAIAASPIDSEGMHAINGGMGNGPQYNNRRTLSLTNGQVIWDFSGNVAEWTDARITGSQPGPTGESGVYRNYKDSSSWDWQGVDYMDTSLLETDIPGVSNFDDSNGIGMIYSIPTSSGTSGFFRGGNWSHTNRAGVYHLSLSSSFTSSTMYLGFRVASPGL